MASSRSPILRAYRDRETPSDARINRSQRRDRYSRRRRRHDTGWRCCVGARRAECRVVVLLSRRDRRQHAEARPAVHGFRIQRHGLRLSPRALQHGLSTAVAQRAARLHHRRPVLASAERVAARHSRAVRQSPHVGARFDLLCPQHRPAPAGAARSPDRLLACADRLRGAGHSAHPDAPRAGADLPAGDRAAMPSARQPAGAVLAGLPSQLLLGGAEICRRLVPAREQALPLAFAFPPGGNQSLAATSQQAVGGRLLRSDPRRGHGRSHRATRPSPGGSRHLQVRRRVHHRRAGQVRDRAAPLPQRRL